MQGWTFAPTLVELAAGWDSEVRCFRVVRASIKQLAVGRQTRFQLADTQPFN